jgi:hypothetical protein
MQRVTALIAEGGPGEQHAAADPGARQPELPVHAGSQGDQVVVDLEAVSEERDRARARQAGVLNVE